MARVVADRIYAIVVDVLVSSVKQCTLDQIQNAAELGQSRHRPRIWLSDMAFDFCIRPRCHVATSTAPNGREWRGRPCHGCGDGGGAVAGQSLSNKWS